MTEGAPEDVDTRYFSWRFALLGTYDVLHLHWPEILLRGESGTIRLAKRLAMRALLLRARVQRLAIVRTTHNVQPHEAGTKAESRLLKAVDRATTIFVHLNEVTDAPVAAEETVILHGHYRDRFASYPQLPREPGRILYFGIIRPRKNVEHLIDVFSALAPAGGHLRIVGSPSPELAQRITSRVEGRDDISARLAFVEDAELVEEVTKSTLVVLPYAEMHNSGAALVALSLDRPLLVPESPANEALKREVGGDWVMTYTGDLDENDLAAAIAAVQDLDPSTRPSLEGRDWNEVGRSHRDVYRRAIDRVQGGRP